jgi:hypothetical protein
MATLMFRIAISHGSNSAAIRMQSVRRVVVGISPVIVGGNTQG